MQIEIQLPREESNLLELTENTTIAELDVLFSSAGVIFWIVNGYPVGRENLIFEGDKIIGIDQAKANHRVVEEGGCNPSPQNNSLRCYSMPS